MSQYNFGEIEKKWQKFWKENKTFEADQNSSKPKFYALDMFPYPSGAGLHVGHPLGYIASDIVSRYKRHQGFNVLHPMGFDSFGLPAEQYAVQTGQHPKVTTEDNIKTYKTQLDNLGFSFDWSKEVQTSSPEYYKWTQWIFLQLFDCWYDNKEKKARRVAELEKILESGGTEGVDAANADDTKDFTASEWKALSRKDQELNLLDYRLAFISEQMVNWCPELGTVLANDEVVNGVSERGGFPVERKTMKQWSLRITAYADRLLKGMQDLDWSDSLKEMQRNWIGKSFGASLYFNVVDSDRTLEVFTTRPDTSFGVTYVSIAPEHDLIDELTTPEQKAEVEAYVVKAKNRSERERQADVKTVSGVFTGSYATNPFNGKQVPVWVADYVLAGYGTGVVMAVPSSDERDYRFAQHFGLEIIKVQEGPKTDISQDDFEPKAGKMINSDFLNGLKVKDAIKQAIQFVSEKKIGKQKVNYRLRDAIFSRQRYWGEPIPIYYEDGVPKPMSVKDLPLILPEIDDFKPTEDGDPPLGRAKDWVTKEGHPMELNTMPGWAGSSWYFFRYMDANNNGEFASSDSLAYWRDVDLYLGGAEHATGHLLYSRFWNKFLFDLGLVPEEEVFKKLVNQGMIQGRSNFVYRLVAKASYVGKDLEDDTLSRPFKSCFVSKKFYDQSKTYDDLNDFKELRGLFEDLKSEEYKGEVLVHLEGISPIHVDVNIVSNDNLDIEAFKNWREEYSNAEFILEDGKYVCGAEVEKMSKSKFNVVNPDDIVSKYGADTLRMYEMFLGPLEQSKPWNTNGIDGVNKFLRKLWRLFYNEEKLVVTDNKPSDKELKVLHTAIKKITEDIEKLSLNTSVSNFMICVNELTALKTSSKQILEPLLVLLSPFAPHFTEELYGALGHTGSMKEANWPVFEEKYLKESDHTYPISINGKVRTKISFPLDKDRKELEAEVLADENVVKWTEGNVPKKVIIVPGKIVNIVI